MTSSATSPNDHWVPVFHLWRFRDPSLTRIKDQSRHKHKCRIWVADFIKKRACDLKIKDVASAKNYESKALAIVYSLCETKIAPAFNTLLDDWLPKNAARTPVGVPVDVVPDALAEPLKAFVALEFARVPRMRAFRRSLTPMARRAYKALIGSELDPDAAADFLEALTLEVVLKDISPMTFFIVPSGNALRLVLSDEPSMLWAERVNPRGAAGRLAPETELFFPLSPDWLLHGRMERPLVLDDKGLPARVVSADASNLLRLRESPWIYCCSKKQALAAIASRDFLFPGARSPT